MVPVSPKPGENPHRLLHHAARAVEQRAPRVGLDHVAGPQRQSRSPRRGAGATSAAPTLATKKATGTAITRSIRVTAAAMPTVRMVDARYTSPWRSCGGCRASGRGSRLPGSSSRWYSDLQQQREQRADVGEHEPQHRQREQRERAAPFDGGGGTSRGVSPVPRSRDGAGWAAPSRPWTRWADQPLISVQAVTQSWRPTHLMSLRPSRHFLVGATQYRAARRTPRRSRWYVSQWSRSVVCVTRLQVGRRLAEVLGDLSLGLGRRDPVEPLVHAVRVLAPWSDHPVVGPRRRAFLRQHRLDRDRRLSALTVLVMICHVVPSTMLPLVTASST